MLPTHVILEACVDSVSTSIQAEKNGAHQIELCGRLDLDGLTPDINLVKAVRAAINIPIKVMLRNRGGNFTYNKDDVAEMKASLMELIHLDIQGIVFGALYKDNSVDVELTQEICQIAGGIPVTFHKAIDECEDILAATRMLSRTSIKEILSSGGMQTALEGKNVLNQMIEISEGKINIMSAGKITKQNIQQHCQSIRGRHFHGKLIVGPLS